MIDLESLTGPSIWEAAAQARAEYPECQPPEHDPADPDCVCDACLVCDQCPTPCACPKWAMVAGGAGE